MEMTERQRDEAIRLVVELQKKVDAIATEIHKAELHRLAEPVARAEMAALDFARSIRVML